MKITTLLIGTSLPLVLAGCHKPQASGVFGAAETAARTAALAAITAKYPEFSSSNLRFSNFNLQAMPNGKEEVFVSYDIPESAKTTTEGKRTTTTKKTINVTLSLAGEVENVYEGTKSESYNVGQ